MKLSELIKDVEYDVLYGTLDKEIESIAYHSEKIEKSTFFTCQSEILLLKYSCTLEMAPLVKWLTR